MGIRRIVGIVLVILGVLALIYQGIPYTEKEKVAELGPMEVSAEQEKSFPIHPSSACSFLRGA